MALHSGTAELRDGDYYGPAVNRAARLVAIGHGGQILLSSATAKLVRDHMPDNMALIDLGKYRLRDIVLPEPVTQLSAADLRTDFPPLRSLAPQLTNLPSPATPFIGRKRELKAVVEMPATSYSAIRLFEACARRMRPDFSMDDEKEGAIRICRLVKGMPLAIELAASWTKTLTCAEIASEIQRNIDFLVTSLRNVPERHRSMQAIFDQSWKLLNVQERDALKRLSVFRGGFDRQAAEKVAGASLLTLSGLVDKSILRRAADGRFHLHGLIRQYTEKQLTAEESGQTRELQCNYYASFLEAQLPGMLGGRQLEALSEIETELENIRVAWHWGIQQAKAEALYKSAETIALFYNFLNRYREGRNAFEQAAQSLPSEDSSEKTNLARIRIWFNLA